MKYVQCGFDCLDFNVLKRNLVHLPNFMKIWKESSRGAMFSRDKVTGISWSSIHTGMHWQKHGISDMWGRKGMHDAGRDGPQDVKLPPSLDFESCEKPYSWDYMNKAGYTTGVFNMPVTYPPKSVSGWMVSGFPCPSNKDITFPASLQKYIRKDYAPDWVNTVCEPKDVDPCKWVDRTPEVKTFLSQVADMEATRMDVLEELLTNEPVDMLYFQSSIVDRMIHTHGINDNTDLPVYAICDKILEDLLELTKPERLRIVSDHGGIGRLHNHNATWLMWGKNINPGYLLPLNEYRANEVDVVPTDLYWMDIPPPAPNEFDGKVVYDCFVRKKHDDDKKIEDQLRALGYID